MNKKLLYLHIADVICWFALGIFIGTLISAQGCGTNVEFDKDSYMEDSCQCDEIPERLMNNFAGGTCVLVEYPMEEGTPDRGCFSESEACCEYWGYLYEE